jgi:DNA helicase HerA-like ATPase
VTLKTEFERKEKAGSAKPLLFVVLDELNKYAPREGNSPIKEVCSTSRARPFAGRGSHWGATDRV